MSQQNSKQLNIGGWKVNYNRGNSIMPQFLWTIGHRLNKKMAVNIVVCGEAGVGKSYFAIHLARMIDPNFTIDQVVYTPSDFMNALKLPMYRAIVFDEPSYALGKRDWYKEVTKALSRTLESFRYLVHPLIVPVININLLEKTMRDHLIQYQVVLQDRGKGTVYRIEASQREDKVYRETICLVNYGLMDKDLCAKDSCLGCRKLSECQIFRAQYERKKSIIQSKRYASDAEDSKKVESRELTNDEIVEKAFTLRDKFAELDEDSGKLRVNVKKLRLTLRRNADMIIGNNKSYDIKLELEEKYKDVFAS